MIKHLIWRRKATGNFRTAHLGSAGDSITATLIFLVAFATYLTTLAPTVPFWDCGEFIT